MFARRQNMGGGSAVLLALQEAIARIRTPRSFLPAGGALGCATRDHIGGRPANSSFSAPTPEVGPYLGCGL